MISPAEFIPIAEDIGLIGPMTDRLLHRACRIAVTWPAELFVACNVSPLQLRDRGLAAMVRAALDDAGLPPHRLELEVTESALVGDLNLARELLNELKASGVRLALDDFGTGYSSLRHLSMLPFDKLKIDAGFVGAMANNLESRKIVAAVVGLGHSLGLITVAEGVEEPETAALLRELGCDVGQGWLFGRPCSAEAAGVLLLKQSVGVRL
jgi:EAL domain-containing protein (putative c-di-GMP-specific phosphodiesterase class I)